MPINVAPTGLARDLRARAESGRPVRIGLIGSGEMGTDIVARVAHMEGIEIGAISELNLANATKAVDIVLAVFLLIGSVTGAQIGARLAQRMRPEYLRLFLATIVLLVAIRMALGLGWRPDEIYTLQAL